MRQPSRRFPLRAGIDPTTGVADAGIGRFHRVPSDIPPAVGRSRQPWLHRLETAVHGNTTCLALFSGDVDVSAPGGEATGIYVDDRRVVSRLVVTVDDVAPVGVVSGSHGATTECLLLARNVGDAGADPTVEVRRVRRLEGSAAREELHRDVEGDRERGVLRRRDGAGRRRRAPRGQDRGAAEQDPARGPRGV